MKVQTKSQIVYPDYICKKGTEFDIDLEKQKLLASGALYIDLGNIKMPVNQLRPKSPYDAETTEHLLNLLKEVKQNGKVMFIDPSIKGEENSFLNWWFESENFFVFSQFEFLLNNKEIRFQRNLFGDVIREAVKEMPDIGTYMVKRDGRHSLVLTRYSDDGEKSLWEAKDLSISEVFTIFEGG